MASRYPLISGEHDTLIGKIVLKKVDDSNDPMSRETLEARVHAHFKAYYMDLLSHEPGALFDERDCEQIYSVIDRMVGDG